MEERARTLEEDTEEIALEEPEVEHEIVVERTFATLGSYLSRTPVGAIEDAEYAEQAAPGAAAPAREPLAQPHPPAETTDIGDRIFNWVTSGFAGLIIAILLTMLAVLLVQARDAVTRFGLGFLTSNTWDAVHDQYGAATSILGTVYTSILALLIAAPIG